MTEQPNPDETNAERESWDTPEGFDPHCPHCNAYNNGVTEAKAEGRRPEPGSLSLCLYCGYICMFGESSFVRPEPELIEAALNQEDIIQAIVARGVMAARGLIPPIAPEAVQPGAN